MANHDRALVPLEAWAFSSPEVKAGGRSIDIGLLAESLLYYDTVLVNITNQPQLAEFLAWAIGQDAFNTLLDLFKDGTLTFYDYSFATAAMRKDGTYSIWSVQDSTQA